MTFIAAAQIETRAAEMWQRHQLAPAFDEERLLDELEIDLLWEEISDEDGGVILGQLIPVERLIILNHNHRQRLEEKDGRLRRYTIGHELGHWVLHSRAASTQTLFVNGRTWCRDGSAHPLERQAEQFSACLLMPRDLVRERLPASPWNGWPPVYRLADGFGVNVTPMKIRLEELGWMHLDDSGTPRSGPSKDPAQDALFET